jgi:hypothetical protein
MLVPALAVLVLPASGCSSHSRPIAYAGDSAQNAQTEPVQKSPILPPATTRWDRYDEVRRWPGAHEKPFLSLGHLSSRYSARVIVDPAARDAYLKLVAGSRLEVGSIVAVFHEDARTAQNGPVFAMHKVAADRWEYLVVDPDGTLQKRGQLALCQRCHAEGVADQLFGLPLTSHQPAPTGVLPGGKPP